MKKISAIFAACNMLDYTKQCVAMLRQFLPAGEYEILAVDNGSSDRTGAWLAAQPGVRLLQNKENRGMAAAWNQAAQQAQGELLLFLHNDVLFTKQTFRQLEAAVLSRPEIGAAGPFTNRCIHGYQKHVASYANFAELQEASDVLEQSGRLQQAVLFLEDFCILLKREAFIAAGPWDERFTYSGLMLSMDYSFRLQQAGYLLKTVPVYVHHERGSYPENGWMHEMIDKQNRAVFSEKWGLDSGYSTNQRYDLLQYIEPEKSGLQVLDIGCACGGNLLYLRQRNPQAGLYGIELNPSAAAIASCFAQVEAMDVEKLERPEWQGKFDYIILADILEHLRNPWQAMRNVCKLLKPDGQVIASIPNILHISNIKNLLNGYWEYEDAGILDRTHLRFFTCRSIQEMVQDAGLELVCMEANQCAVTEGQQALLQVLTKLPQVNCTAEELMAYQWRVVARPQQKSFVDKNTRMSCDE